MVAQDSFDRPSPPSPARCAAVATAASAALSGLLCWLLPVLTGPAEDADGLAGALTRGCAGVALLAAAWLWLGTLRLVLAAHGGRGEHDHLTGGLPAPVRRLVLAACGVALTGSLAVSTQAGAGVPQRDGGALPAPDRAATAAQVVVLPGDSLWSIAADTLPADASDARVAERWPRIYALNRTVIGPDPDLIQPAQRLVLPSR